MLKLFRKRVGNADPKPQNSTTTPAALETNAFFYAPQVQQLRDAVESNNVSLVKKLASSYPSTVHASLDDVGQTCLHLAASTGNTECLEILMKYGDANTPDAGGMTAIHAGAAHPSVLFLLLKKKAADANRLAYNRQSLLHIMAKHLSPVDEELWALFKKRGVQTSIVNVYGDTPLHVCCQTGHFALAELLLTVPGLNVNLANKRGETPLHIAAEKDHLNLVRLLLIAGASPHAADGQGRTPLEVASSPDSEMMVREAIRSLKASSSGRDTPLRCASLLQKQHSLSSVPHVRYGTPSHALPVGRPPVRDNSDSLLSSSSPGPTFMGRDRAMSFTQASHRLIIMDEERSGSRELLPEPTLQPEEIHRHRLRLETELVDELTPLLEESFVLDALTKIILSKSFNWHMDYKTSKVEVLKFMSDFVSEDEKQDYLKHLKTHYAEDINIIFIKRSSSKKLSKKERSQKRLTMVDKKINAYQWELMPEQFELGPLIGNGSFGAVYQGTLTSNGDDIAVKLLTEDVGPDYAATFMKEIAILSRLSHPNVVGFVGACITSQMALVMEYCSGGNLKQFLQSHPTSWRLKLRLARQVADALKYLHQQTPSIVHRDLKSQNILVTSQGDAKVSDFGLSKTLSRTNTEGSRIGTLNWLAPEVLRGDAHYSTSADVYAFGMVLYEILMDGKPPYEAWQPLQIVRAIDEGLHPEIPLTCDPSFRELLEQCWTPDPLERPTFIDISDRLQALEKTSLALAAQSSSSSDTSSPPVSPHSGSLIIALGHKKSGSELNHLKINSTPQTRSASATGFHSSPPKSPKGIPRHVLSVSMGHEN